MGFVADADEPAGDRLLGIEKRVDDFGNSVLMKLEILERGQLQLSVATAQLDELIRETRQIISLVASDSPRLFSMAPADIPVWSPKKYWQHRFHLQLWCESPNSSHPTGDPYTFEKSQEWFAKALPLIKIMQQLLQYVPLISPAIPAPGQFSDWSKVSAEINVMKQLVDTIGDRSDNLAGVENLNLDARSSEGVELRVLKELLNELDPLRIFRRLRQVSGNGGDVLWVCEHHFAEHDPGLPNLHEAQNV